MRQLVAVHTIGLGGKYHAPGSPIEVEDGEAERLIALGAASAVETAPPAPEEAEADLNPQEQTEPLAAALNRRRNGRH
jgi:hypothetical protein